MKRSHFIKSTALGLGLSSLGLIGHTLNTKTKFIRKSNPKIIKNGEGDNQIILGDHQIIKLIGKDTNGQYTLIEQYNNPGVAIPLHVHQDEDEIFHVLEGSLEIQVGDDIQVLNSGDIGFCPRGIPHSWKVVGNGKARVMLSVFPSGLEFLFKELETLPAGPSDFKKIAKISKKYNIQFV